MTSPSRRLFVLDANVFITAYRSYYAFDLCPGFWDCLLHYFNEGRILSIDRVRDELVGNVDELSNWVKDLPEGLFVPSLQEPVTDAYREVISWVYANDQFSGQAKDEFSRGADGWLIAYGIAHDHRLVTLEAYQQNVRRRVPIPNVCERFGIEHVDTFGMLRELDARFGWHPSG